MMESELSFLDRAAPVKQFTVGHTFTIGHVQTIRLWLHGHGFKNLLVIEHINGRNVVLLRVMLNGNPVDFEASWLNTIHRKLTSPQSIRQRLEQKAMAEGLGVEPSEPVGPIG